MQRRTFIKGLGGLSLTTLATGVYTWKIEPFCLDFVKKDMTIRNLPKNLEGKTLMQISDIHIGNRFDYQFIIDSFQKAQLFAPDIVVYTGDYVSYENKHQFPQLQEVLEYTVKGKLGTIGILSNHDYGKNWSEGVVADQISKHLQEAGVSILRNASTVIEGLNIHGLDDYWALNFNPEPTLSEIQGDEANLVLCHNPDVCDLDVWHGYQGWILAGHTHGGQCKPPFLRAPMLPVKNKRYDQGEINLNDGRTLYINRALGHLWQVRFNVRPEITLFTLKS